MLYKTDILFACKATIRYKFTQVNFVVFCMRDKLIMLELIYLYFPPSSQLVYVMFLSCRPFILTEVTSTPTRPVDNVVITTKGPQDRNINILDGTTVENKGKLIPSSALDSCTLLTIWLKYQKVLFLLTSIV